MNRGSLRRSRNSTLMLVALCAVLLISTADSEARASDEIFDGMSLDGWRAAGAVWRVEDQAITGEIPDGTTSERDQFLFWNGEVADFQLDLEFRSAGGHHAGAAIQLRAQRRDAGPAAGYRVELLQGAGPPGSIRADAGRELLVEPGSAVSIAPDGRRWLDRFTELADFAQLLTDRQWNSCRIVAAGPHLEVWINAQRVAVLDDHQLGQARHSGALALQLHRAAGPASVQFRNIRLRSLGETALPVLPATGAVGGNRQTESPVLWHLRSNPARPTPIDNPAAQALVADIKLTEGFQAELIAAEPDVHQPIAFAIDPRGRLWVVEAFSYPVKQADGQGQDRIRILEDSDGDGLFETRKTFAEGLNLVSGIEIGFGGVWVGAAPQLLFIPDRDANDVADGPPQVLLDGFGYQDTHETLNSLTWGPDGWLYGNQGVFNTAQIGQPGSADAQRTTLRAGVWRYHPIRHEFEVFAHGGSNQWGLAFNQTGDLFMTHCRSYWGGGGTTHVIRNGHFWNQSNADYPDYISNSSAPGLPHLQNFLPASARYDSGEGGAGKPGTDAVYGGHSHVGTMIYGGDNWPEIYRDHLFTHNLHGHQINHQVNVRVGSAYETFHAGYDLAYIADPAYIGVELKYGPDGAVYVIDWVDRQHCHNPRPEQWDRSNGRIYRISWAATYRPCKVDLTSKSNAELVELLGQRNRWFATTARRLLQHRAVLGSIDSAVLDKLVKSAGREGADRDVLESLWALHAIGRFDAAVAREALAHRSDAVRANAVRLATDQRSSLCISTDQLLQLAASDPSAHVRLAIASALPALPRANRWQVAAALSQHAEDAGDRFLPKMVWYGLAGLVEDDIAGALALADATPLPDLSDAIVWYAARSPVGRDQIVRRVNLLDDQAARRMLSLMHFSLQNESRVQKPLAWDRVQARFSSDSATTGNSAAAQASVRRICDELSAVFGVEAVLQQLRGVLADQQATVQQRRRALAILHRSGDRQSIAIYPQLLADRELRAQVIPLLASSQDPQIARQLLESMPDLTAQEKASALGVLTSRRPFALELLRAVDQGAFDRAELSALQIRQVHSLGDPELTQLLEKVWGKIGSSSADAQRLMDKIRKTYSTAPLWAYSEDRGQQVYQKTCANCHPLDGSTVPLGPGLKGSWRNGLDYFLENIIDPNAVVGENYRLTQVVTTSGQIISGLLDSESSTALVLRTAEQPVTIPLSDIDERRRVDQSLMPTGLLDNMSEVEVIELLKFLLRQQ